MPKFVINGSFEGEEYRCKDCGGSFITRDKPNAYDPTYCPYCGSEALSEVEF